jgi:hypothetical protein
LRPLCEAAKAGAHVLDTLCVASGGERLERLLEQISRSLVIPA